MVGRGRRLVALAAAFTALGAALAASGASAQTPGAAPAPGGFQVQGSNGFTVSVFAQPAGWGFSSQISLVASNKGALAYYTIGGTVTSTSFAADFGALGKISVIYRPTGGAEEFRGRCGSGRFFASGFYEGTIEFHGEGGYTSVSSNWARGRRDASCGSRLKSVGSGITGAQLSASSFSFGSADRLGFEAVKNHPTARATFRAFLGEANGDVGIVRSVRARAPTGSFFFGPSLRRAMVNPPSPFSGAGSFRRDVTGRGHWRGDLTVDFPGKSGVRLTGKGFRADLRHAEVKETLR